MPPKAKARKPKKPVQQKQKQRQSQRVVVNINQAKARAKRRASKPRQAQQQVSIQPQPQIIMTGGSALPTYVNPAPIQSSGGFNPPPPTPSLGAPLEVPVFAGESVRAIGDEEVRVPLTSPVTTITPVSAPPPPIIRQPPPAPAQPPTLISSAPSKSDRQFISAPPPSLNSEVSRISSLTGMNPELVARALEIRSKKPSPPPSLPSQEPQLLTLMNPNPSVGSSAFPSTASSVIASQSGFNIPDDNSLSSITAGGRRPVPRIYVQESEPEPESTVSSSRSSDLSSPYASSLDLSAIDRKLNPPKPEPKPEPKPLNVSRKFIKGDMSVEGAKSFETISTRSGFYNEPYKGSFTNEEIIVPPKEVVVLKKPESKRTDPYDIFSSDSDLTVMTSPMKKRTVTVSSDSDAPAGRRMPTISEKPKPEPKINSKTKLADLQAVAEGRDIPIRWPDGKKKNRETLLGEIRVDQAYPKGFGL